MSLLLPGTHVFKTDEIFTWNCVLINVGFERRVSGICTGGLSLHYNYIRLQNIKCTLTACEGIKM